MIRKKYSLQSHTADSHRALHSLGSACQHASPLTVAQQGLLPAGEVSASHRSGRSCQNGSPKQELRISTNRKELDLAMIQQFLGGQSGWAKGIPLETLLRGIEHSICFGGFLGPTQVAFARVISDCATFANLLDVLCFQPTAVLVIARL